LVVKNDLIEKRRDIVERLVDVSQKATDWINRQPVEAAEVVSRQLKAAGGSLLPSELTQVAAGLEITQEVLLRSMERLEYTTNIDPEMVQETIDYLVKLGYIRSRFSARDILDLRFIK
jgi:NitT/TauT family transport system substrate-binding protein